MMIHALIPVHNSADCIIPCLESLVGKVDNIIILDNKWIGFEDDKSESKSTDGTGAKIFEFIRKLPHYPITYIYLPDRKFQHEVRTYLLNQVPDNDWFLIIDSDEELIYWYPNIKIFLSQMPNDLIGLRIFGRGGKIPMPTARICRKISGLQWSKKHRLLELDGKKIDPLTFPVASIQIDHQLNFMAKNSRVKMEKYKTWRESWEQNNS